MVKRVLGLMVPLVFASNAAYAQVGAGTLEVSGITSLVVSTQTAMPSEGDDTADMDVTSITGGADIAYYFARAIGVGVLLNFQSISFDTPDTDATKISSALAGPVVKFRIPLGSRADFVLAGSAGINRGSFDGGTGSALGDTDTEGTYWLAGGGLSFLFAENASFDVGVRYQASSISFDDTNDFDSSGFGVALGFSVYIGR